MLIAAIDYALSTKRFEESILSWYAAATDLFMSEVIIIMLAKIMLLEHIFSLKF